MRTKFLFLLTVALALSCSSEGDGNVFDAHLLLDGHAFIPEKNDDGDHFNIDGVLMHATADTLNGHAKARTFYLMRYDGPTGYSPFIRVTIIFPRESANIDGTYSFSAADAEPYRYPVGRVRNAQGFMVAFNAGSVTVSAKGGRRYMLAFHDVTGNFTSVPFDDLTTLEGYFDGTFKDF